MVKFSDLEKGSINLQKPQDKNRGRPSRSSGLSFRDLEKETHRMKSREVVQPKEVSEEERRAIYDTATEYLTGVLEAVRKRRRFALEAGEEIVRRIIEPRSAVDPLLIRAIHEDNPQEFLVYHCVNVTIFAVKLAAELGLSKFEQEQIGLAALLHEVGMGVIPEKLIYKKQKLDEQEYTIFKKRPEYAYKILKGFGGDYAFIAETALQVHECMDGSGYPVGLKGDEIHMFAQIVGLVDMYEALTHSRPQREKFLHFFAIKQIIKIGKARYPKKYLKALLQIFSIFPLHSFVKLNSNAIGRVIQTYPEQPLRPKIEVVLDSQGRRVLSRHVIDLSENSILYIVDSVSEKDIAGLVERPVAKQFPQATASIRDDLDYVVIEDAEDAEGAAPQDSDILEIIEEDFEPGAPERENDESGVDRSSFTMSSEKAEESADELIDENVVEFPAMEKGRGIRRHKWILPVIGIVILVGALFWQLGLLDFTSKKVEQPSIAVKPSGKKVSATPSKKAKKPSTDSTAPAKKGEKPTATVSSTKEKEAGKTDGKQVLKEQKQSAPAPAAVKAPPSSKQAPSKTPPVTAAKPAGEVAISSPTIQPDLEKTRTEAATGPKPAGNAAAAWKARGGSYPFSIKLDSFRTLKEVETVLPSFKDKGLNAYWVKVNLGSQGIWYRIFAGFYQNEAQAAAVIHQVGLKNALVKATKYAALIGVFTSQTEIDQKIKSLSDKGYSPYVIQGGDQTFHLFVGAFYTRKGAEEQVADLLSNGIQSELVVR